VKALAAALVALAPLFARADDPVQRAVIERDRQSAEFANPALRDFNARREAQNLPPRPDQPDVERRARDAELLREAAPPAAPAPDYRPLPLPGGPGHGVDPIPVQGAGG
jgi:hypothetical protein